MFSVWVVSGSEVGAWVAALGALVALGAQGYNTLKKRHKEKDEMTVALDHAPEVKTQLELGNVGEAVKHLNAVVLSQAAHIDRQEQRIIHQDEEIDRLRKRNDALEAEASGWEAKYNDSLKKLEEAKRTYARSLAMMREKGREER